MTRPRIAVLASPESWYLRDLQRAAGDRCEIVPAAFSELRAALTADGLTIKSGEVDLTAANAVLVRTMPPGTLEQVIFRMDALLRLEAQGQTILNAPRAIEAAVDKFLTSARLAEAGFTSPRTICCQTADDAMLAFAELGGDVVLKPLFGSEGRGITRLNDEALAIRAFKMLAQLGAILYVQEFIPHEGFDLRLFVLGERVLGMRRRNPLDWRTNVSRGASTEAFTPDAELSHLALKAAQSVGAEIAGVDFLPGRDGQLYAIEVNAVPGWKALARTLDLDIAQLVLDYTIVEQQHRLRT